MWKKLIIKSPTWLWRGDKLFHVNAASVSEARKTGRLQYWFVKLVYADQNSAQVVRKQINDLLSAMPTEGVGLNVGSGHVRYPRVVNLDVADGECVDILGHGSQLPFKDGSLDLVIMQEVLEHVADFQQLLDEVHRVLKPGGICYCQVPFQIGFHPGPCDYWRFSKQGLEHLFSPPRWDIKDLEITLGHGSGFYRIAVEFFAVTASCLLGALYKPVKFAAALLLYPLKLADLLTRYSREKDRIPGGYLCVAYKRQEIMKAQPSRPDLGTSNN